MGYWSYFKSKYWYFVLTRFTSDRVMFDWRNQDSLKNKEVVYVVHLCSAVELLCYFYSSGSEQWEEPVIVFVLWTMTPIECCHTLYAYMHVYKWTYRNGLPPYVTTQTYANLHKGSQPLSRRKMTWRLITWPIWSLCSFRSHKLKSQLKTYKKKIRCHHVYVQCQLTDPVKNYNYKTIKNIKMKHLNMATFFLTS